MQIKSLITVLMSLSPSLPSPRRLRRAVTIDLSLLRRAVTIDLSLLAATIDQRRHWMGFVFTVTHTHTSREEPDHFGGVLIDLGFGLRRKKEEDIDFNLRVDVDGDGEDDG
ncbi:hypothetical protein Q3G72_018679 [Acer saccharum]|nr:hypothetical protein Q3G72_018679 [Acer saccharum]